MIYLFSPSAYTIRAMLALLFGSYSIVFTVPGIPSLFLLKSMILYLRLTPPPLCLTVIFPLAFLPECFFNVAVRDFSGLLVVISSKVETVMPRCPGVVGLYFLIPILSTSYITDSGRTRSLCCPLSALRSPSCRRKSFPSFFPFSLLYRRSS